MEKRVEKRGFSSPDGVPLVVVMGVSGSGKTTVAVPLSARLGIDVGEADDFHPQRNVEKMAAGDALDDADREPWLRAIGGWLAGHRDAGAIVTCSALKRSYRDLLTEAAPGVVFLHLHGPRELLEERMRSRSGHFMPASLLDSQLETLEPLESDEAGIVVDVSLSVDGIVDRFLAWWETQGGHRGGRRKPPRPSTHRRNG